MKNIALYLFFIASLLLMGCDKETPEPQKPVEVSSIEVQDKELIMKPGQKVTLSYTVLPADAANKDVEISSSNTEVVAVNGKEITALALGEAEITISSKSNPVSAKIQVEVVPIDATELKLNKTELELLIGEKEILVATIVPDNTTNKELEWKSSDVAVATVSATGEVEGVGIGTAEITVITKDGKVSAKASVEIKPILAESIVIEPARLALAVQSTFNLVANVLPANTSDKSLEWSSSAPSIVSVSNTGQVKALQLGSAVITAKAKLGDVQKSITVEVTEDIKHVMGRLSFSLMSNPDITLAMQVFMSNKSNKALNISKVEAFDKGVLFATANSAAVLPGQTDDQGVIVFTKAQSSPVVDDFPPNWHTKVYFELGGKNYNMTIRRDGFTTVAE